MLYTGRILKIEQFLQEKNCTIENKFLLEEKTAKSKIFLRGEKKRTYKYSRGTRRYQFFLY